MNATGPHLSLKLSHQLYQHLLAAYPRSHRERYGAAMAQLFRDQCRDAWVAGRAWGLVTLWLRILPDLLKTSFLERCASLNPGKFMSSKLNPFSSPGRTPFATFFAVFTVVFLIILGATVVATLVMPKTYLSRAQIIISQPLLNQPADDIDRLIKYTCLTIRSPVVLSNVVSQLNLNARWGEPSAGGKALDTESAMAMIQISMEVSPIPKTTIINVDIYRKNAHEALELARAVSAAYLKYGCPLDEERQKVSFSIFSPAHLDIRPMSSHPQINVHLGVILGAFLGAVAGLVAASITWGKRLLRKGLNPATTGAAL